MSINDEKLLDVVAAKDEALAQKDRQIVELQLMVKSKQQQLDVSIRQCEQLLRRLYGPKSEKFHPDQPFLELIMAEVIANAESEQNAEQELIDEDEEREEGQPEETAPEGDEPVADPEGSAPEKPRKKSRRNGRVPIPDWVQRRIIEVDVDDEQKIDLETGEPLARIGHEDTIKLEVIPSKLQANVYRRWKYGPVRDANGRTRIIIPELPRFPLGSSKADAGLLADVIVAKTCDHMPLYRQEQKSEREGLRLPRTTTDDWYLKSAELMRDLYGLQLTATRSAPILKTDATRLPLFIPGNGKTHSAAMWVWIGADGENTPQLTFQYTFDQTKERPGRVRRRVPRHPGVLPGRRGQRVRSTASDRQLHRSRMLESCPQVLVRCDRRRAAGSSACAWRDSIAVPDRRRNQEGNGRAAPMRTAGPQRTDRGAAVRHVPAVGKDRAAEVADGSVPDLFPQPARGPAPVSA